MHIANTVWTDLGSVLYEYRRIGRVMIHMLLFSENTKAEDIFLSMPIVLIMSICENLIISVCGTGQV